MFRDIDPKRIIAFVKCNPNLLLASKENAQIFMLATTSRSNAKSVAQKRSITNITKTSKQRLNLKKLVCMIYAYMTANIIQCI